MRRTFDIFYGQQHREERQRREREYGREDEDRRYGFIDDRQRLLAEDREGYVPGYPPTNYGVSPEPPRPHEVWRGRNEEHDFWGFERHPHPSLWARVKGAFTGRGPKNYVRADERIREDVCEHLSAHPYIDASDIEVTVREGEVTLTGNVEGRMVKRAAEECCDHVRGVKDVHNHLRVKRPDQPSP